VTERGDHERRARQFAGLALGTSWWDNRNETELHIQRAVPEEAHGIEAVVLKFDIGERTAGNFLTDVQTGRYDPYCDGADEAYLFATDERDDEDLAPCEQWSEDLYQTLVSQSGIPERAVAVVGLGNDNHVYVPADPFSQESVRAALRSEGYQPTTVEDGGFGYRIVPDFDGDEGGGSE
jgi:hypothetical protein